MAVFTPVTTEEARAYLSAYDIGELTHIEGIEEGVSNTNFRVETTSDLYALTLFEAATPEEDLPYFMDYTHHLDAKGYPAPGPVVMRSGEMIGRINGKACALIKWLPGRWPRDPDVRHAGSAGEYLAKLHLVGADFTQTRANSMGIDVWPWLIERCEPKAASSVRATMILEDLSEELAYLSKHWVQPSSSEAVGQNHSLPRGGDPCRLFHRQCADE